MTCDKATFMLERRWDKTLTGDEERALDEHIQQCATCRQEAEAISFADAAFLRIPDRVPPMDIAAAVARRVAEECPAEPRRGWFWMAVFVAMAAIAAVWHFGITVPASVVGAPQYKAAHDIAVTLTTTVAAWLKPAVLIAKSFTPAAPILIPAVGIMASLETAALGTWILKRGSHRQLTGRV
jgi:predicted anti-sigma-YlaC factor YlaD